MTAYLAAHALLRVHAAAPGLLLGDGQVDLDRLLPHPREPVHVYEGVSLVLLVIKPNNKNIYKGESKVIQPIIV